MPSAWLSHSQPSSWLEMLSGVPWKKTDYNEDRQTVWGMTFRTHRVQLSSLHSPNTAFTGVLFSVADISSLPWVSSDVFIALYLCNAGSRLKRDNLPEFFFSFFFLFPPKKKKTTAQKQLPEFNVSTTVNAKLNQIKVWAPRICSAGTLSSSSDTIQKRPTLKGLEYFWC